MTTLTSAALAEIHGGVSCQEIGAALRGAGYASGNFALVELGWQYTYACPV